VPQGVVVLNESINFRKFHVLTSFFTTKSLGKGTVMKRNEGSDAFDMSPVDGLDEYVVLFRY
jgi:hypothetical protein